MTPVTPLMPIVTLSLSGSVSIPTATVLANYWDANQKIEYAADAATSQVYAVNHGAGGRLLLNSGRALQLGATNDLAIHTFASGFITYFDLTLNSFVQVSTDGTDYTFNSATVNNILTHHAAFTQSDLDALNANPNLMAKLHLSQTGNISELSAQLQSDDVWYACTEESGLGVIGAIQTPTPGTFSFTSDTSSKTFLFKSPVGTGLSLNGTYYAGAGNTSVLITSSDTFLEFEESSAGVLTEFQARSSALNGCIPDVTSNADFDVLYLDDNNLVGDIPDLSAQESWFRVFIYNNKLTGFSGGPMKIINRFHANNNALTVEAVDAILQALVDGGTSGAIIMLEGGTNGVPTNTAAIDALRATGAYVKVEGGY